jgi:hypothetical protein
MTNVLQHPPKTGEVWTVDDDEVRLHVEGREDKGARPVVILMAPDIDISKIGIANVVPLTASSTPDSFIIPITEGYEDIAQGFSPDNNSCAVINFYQPIETRFFRKYRGRLDETTQVMLKSVLQMKVIGIADYDFTG